jgi:hypothetical protein
MIVCKAIKQVFALSSPADKPFCPKDLEPLGDCGEFI